jgi:hypothetical protein
MSEGRMDIQIATSYSTFMLVWCILRGCKTDPQVMRENNQNWIPLSCLEQQYLCSTIDIIDTYHEVFGAISPGFIPWRYSLVSVFLDWHRQAKQDKQA